MPKIDTVQLIYVGDRIEIADADNSEVPEWPVQDQGGRWNYCQFEGQRVAYDRAHVTFGFLACPLNEDEVSALDMDDLPRDVCIAGGRFYRS